MWIVQYRDDNGVDRRESFETAPLAVNRAAALKELTPVIVSPEGVSGPWEGVQKLVLERRV